MKSSSFDKYQKRRLLASYLSVVLSITLVLLMVGFLALTVLKYTKLSSYIKEKVSITLYLVDDLEKEQKQDIEKYIKTKDFVNKIHFVSKAEAAKDFSKDIGEDFLTFLGDNPLKSYYEIGLKADFVSPSQLIYISRALEQNAFIEEVVYDAPLVNLLTKNIKTIGFWLLVGAVVLAFIAILLLNSSIRLSIYAKRFNIKTMQMVGATKSFIRKPFIWSSIRLGLVGAFVACAIILLLCFRVDDKLPALALLEDREVLAIVLGGVFAMALVITTISSFLATQRFLKLKTEQLHY